jgi:hypothetical protein
MERRADGEEALSPDALQLLAACDATRSDELVEAGQRSLRAFRDTMGDADDAALFAARVEALARILVGGYGRVVYGHTLGLSAGDAAALLRVASRLCAPECVLRTLRQALASAVFSPPWPLGALAELCADEARAFDRHERTSTSRVVAPDGGEELLQLVTALAAARPVFERGELPKTLAALVAAAADAALDAATLRPATAMTAEQWRAADPFVLARVGERVVSQVCREVAFLDDTVRFVPAAPLGALDAGGAAPVPLLTRAELKGLAINAPRVLGEVIAGMARGKPNALVAGAVAAIVAPTAFAERAAASADDATSARRLLRLMCMLRFPLGEAAAVLAADGVQGGVT